MHLGTLLEKLRRETDAGLALAALDDVALFSEIAAVGEAYGEGPAEYLSGAASRFANLAEHEDWLRLMTAVERSADAARTLLTTVVRWSLDRDREGMSDAVDSGCGCASHGHGPGHVHG